MNFLRKYSVYLAILLYLIIGIGWYTYLVVHDSQFVFQWSWAGLLIDAIFILIWLMYPVNLLLSGEKPLMIVGGIGLVVVIIVLMIFSLLLRKANQGKERINKK